MRGAARLGKKRRYRRRIGASGWNGGAGVVALACRRGSAVLLIRGGAKNFRPSLPRGISGSDNGIQLLGREGAVPARIRFYTRKFRHDSSVRFAESLVIFARSTRANDITENPPRPQLLEYGPI